MANSLYDMMKQPSANVNPMQSNGDPEIGMIQNMLTQRLQQTEPTGADIAKSMSMRRNPATYALPQSVADSRISETLNNLMKLKEMQARMQPETITPYQAASLALQERRLNQQGGGTPYVDENGEIIMQPQRKLSATEQKAFKDQTDLLDSVEKARSAFQRAKEYQGQPMFSGFGAETLAAANRVPILGSMIDDTKAANTTGYQNIIQEGQYAKLQSTFPGAISNAEREAIEKLGALASYKPEEQKAILQNAEAGIAKLEQVARQRASDIATGAQYEKAANYEAIPELETDDFEAQYNALPSGATYTAPDGSKRRKP